MIMNWSFTKFKSHKYLFLGLLLGSSPSEYLITFSTPNQLVMASSTTMFSTKKLDKNSTFIFPEAISTMILTLRLLSNCFLLHFGVHWRLCAGHSFQYFLNKIFRHYFFDLTFFSETDQFVAGPRTDN